ncbi:MAG: hypothetical protein K0S71_336 [Clostridia bacterium]|jgi:hypothetical protein|nr:hypothetical protein [Clostridia bacterium]
MCDGNCIDCMYYIESSDFETWPFSCMWELPVLDLE